MKDVSKIKAMLEGYKIEAKSERFFEYMRTTYNSSFNMYKDGDTFYVTQEIYDKLKEK